MAMSRRVFHITTLAVCVLSLAAGLLAQSKPTLKPVEYDQFETVFPAAQRGGLSPDGRWLAYSISKVNGDSELRIVPAAGGNDLKTIPFGSGAVFTPNSQWIGYGIGQSEAEAERLRAARQPVQRKQGLLNLSTNAETIVDGIESAAFDRTGQFVAMKRYAPAPPAGAAPAGAAAPAPADRKSTRLNSSHLVLSYAVFCLQKKRT